MEITNQIPIEVANDNYLKSYKIMSGDKVAKYFERKEDPRDQKPVVERCEVIVKPMFHGEWEDKTEEYLKREKERKAKANAEKRALKAAKEAEEQDEEQIEKDKQTKEQLDVNCSGRARTKEEIREEELRRAEQLLKAIMGGK